MESGMIKEKKNTLKLKAERENGIMKEKHAYTKYLPTLFLTAELCNAPKNNVLC